MIKLKSVLGVALALLLVVGAASANVLVNPGFESPVIVQPPPEYYGAGDGWTSFGGGIFTIDALVGIPPNSGAQLVKMFGGCCSGAWQEFPAVAGQTWNGGVWMRNDSHDPMGGGQVAAVNIEWHAADGSLISFISNGTFTAASTPDVWTLQPITGIAPAGTAFARLVIITGDFVPGGPAGAPFYDDAFFELLDDPVPVDESTWGKIKALYQ